MNECAAEDLRRSDAELNSVYRQILSRLSGDSAQAARIRKAEAAWITFRDAEINALFPENNLANHGSVYPMCRAIYLTRLTAERTKQLKKLLESEEGDVCAPQLTVAK